jgi:hypothetical protein
VIREFKKLILKEVIKDKDINNKINIFIYIIVIKEEEEVLKYKESSLFK